MRLGTLGRIYTGVAGVSCVAVGDEHLDIKFLGVVKGTGCELPRYFLGWCCGGETNDA
jgi:hypothetical protein